MSKELQLFLIDLLQAVEPFKDTITVLMIREKEGKIAAAAKSRDGSISVQAISKNDVPGFKEKACMGSLPLLLASLKSPQMKDGKLTLGYGTASNGSDEVLQSITMKGKNRFNFFYRAIDPFVNSMNRIKLPTGLDWPIAFGIDADFIKSFDEMFKINSLAPKINSERDDIFVLVLVDGGIEAIFGSQGSEMSVLLSETVEAQSATDKVSAHLSIAKTRAILRLIGKGSGIGYLSDKAVRIDIETEQAEYKYVMSAKKVMSKD